MASFRRLAGALALTAPLVISFGQTFGGEPAAGCRLAPPRGPFKAAMEPSSQPPTVKDLPSNPGAWTTLISPGSEFRWVPQSGLVESLDGSVRLHGITAGPRNEKSRLNVVVLVDYDPVETAVVSVWDAERKERLGRMTGPRAGADTEGASVAFDVELPRRTVPTGTYREVETLVWLKGGPIDARRWTVYAGPNPPAAVDCIDADLEVPMMPTRSRLDADGRFVVRSPRAATLAVVPLLSAGPGAARFLRIGRAGHGWVGRLGPEVELAAVWEGPFTGPGRNWISSFWSAFMETAARTADTEYE
jgi:hypothetical protein